LEVFSLSRLLGRAFLLLIRLVVQLFSTAFKRGSMKS
jgi:hypothetical protein